MGLEASSTFGFEKAWFVKALPKIKDDNSIFLKNRLKEAQLYFGIGSKKVEALQKWLSGANIISGPKSKSSLSSLGELLYKYDPHLYEYGSWITILHNLGSFPHTPEIIYWYLNEFQKSEFSISELKGSLLSYGDFKKSYVDNAWQALKNAFSNTPFGNEFGLLEEVDEAKGVYRKKHPAKEYFHPLMFAYCILGWAKINKKDVVLIEDVVATKGLPGKVFSLPERYVQEKLTEIDLNYRKRIFDVDRKAGLNRITFINNAPLEILKQYFEEISARKFVSIQK